MSYKTKQDVGREAVTIVLPIIEKHLGEIFTATKERFNTLDLYSTSFLVEVKSRCPPYYPGHPKLQEGWLIPACKIERSKKEEKQTYFFYFFWMDQSLWKYKFNQADFLDLVPKRAYPSPQMHYSVPLHLWESVPHL
jgi:hypothetical protein